MYRAGYNRRRYDQAPYNGRGRYVLQAAVALVWNVSQPLYSVAASLAASWNIRALVSRAGALAWDIGQQVAGTLSFGWHSTSGVLGSIRCAWNTAAAPRWTSGIDRRSTTGSLSRHTGSTELERSDTASGMSRHATTTIISRP